MPGNMLQEPVLRIPHRNKHKPQCSTTHTYTHHHQTNHPARIPIPCCYKGYSNQIMLHSQLIKLLNQPNP
uniref:Uncharacterized protein n=1 Tax=Arundo donax TaxID=35708 RepID=A0A0A8YQ99_ARUDO